MTAGPLTPPTINKLPEGLLGFLGIKNGGRYPDQLSSTLLPVADLLAWYANTNRQYFRTAINIAALGQTTFFTVPAGEYWYVLHASFITGAMGGGQVLNGFLSFTDAAGLRNIGVNDRAAAAATVGEVFASQARDFWMGPGESIGLYASELAVGPIVAPILSIAVARLSV